MVVRVTSKDGTTLFTKVKANPGIQFALTQEALQKVAGSRTTDQLLDEGDWHLTEEAAGAPPVPYRGPRATVIGDDGESHHVD